MRSALPLRRAMHSGADLPFTVPILARLDDFWDHPSKQFLHISSFSTLLFPLQTRLQGSRLYIFHVSREFCSYSSTGDVFLIILFHLDPPPPLSPPFILSPLPILFDIR